METITSTINALLSDTLLNNLEMVQLVEVPDNMLAVLQNGARAALKISISDSTLLTQLEINNQTFDVKIKGPLPQPNPGELLEIPVKISSGNRLQLPTSTTPTAPQKTVYPQSSAIDIEINPTKQLQKVVMEPLKLDDVVSAKLDELKAPVAIKEQVMEQVPRLQISISALGQKTPPANSILQPLYDTLKQMVYTNNSSEFSVLQNQLQQNISELVGQNIGGVVSHQVNNTTIVTTDLGKSFFNAPLKLQPNEPLSFTVNDIVFPRKTENAENIFSKIVSLFEHEDVDISVALHDNPKVFNKLLNNNIPQHVVSKSPLLNILATKLPTYNQNLLPNIVTFYQAAVQKDVTIWLGKDNIKQIVATSPEVSSTKVITELNNFVASSVKDTPMWRIVEIPVYSENNFKPLKIALKKDAEDNKNEQTKDKKGTRFVVETQFSKLGNFQFDGFVRSGERNLDLIIRTSSSIDDDFCSQIINLFKNSLYNLDYKGNVKINQKDTFINFYEDTSRKQGIYI